MKITALIPAKQKSERVPNKNIKFFNGYPLIENKVRQLLKSKIINRVVVGTNSNQIKKILNKYDIDIVDRESDYCGTLDNRDTFTANDMIYDLSSKVKSDISIWVHCTNPLVDSEIYDQALKKFFENEKNKKFDSLASVDKLQGHFFNKKFQVINYNPYAKRHKLAPEIDSYFVLNGAFFIQRHKTMIKNRYFFGKKPYLFEVPINKSVDINYPEDFKLAKYYLSQNRN